MEDLYVFSGYKILFGVGFQEIIDHFQVTGRSHHLLAAFGTPSRELYENFSRQLPASSGRSVNAK